MAVGGSCASAAASSGEKRAQRRGAAAAASARASRWSARCAGGGRRRAAAHGGHDEAILVERRVVPTMAARAHRQARLALTKRAGLGRRQPAQIKEHLLAGGQHAAQVAQPAQQQRQGVGHELERAGGRREQRAAVEKVDGLLRRGDEGLRAPDDAAELVAAVEHAVEVVASNLDELHRRVLRALRGEPLERHGVAELKLVDKEGKVLEREEEARAADVGVDEGRLVHGWRGGWRQRSVEEGGRENRQKAAELQPGQSAWERRVQEGGRGVLVAEQQEVNTPSRRCRGPSQAVSRRDELVDHSSCKSGCVKRALDPAVRRALEGVSRAQPRRMHAAVAAVFTHTPGGDDLADPGRRKCSSRCLPSRALS